MGVVAPRGLTLEQTEDFVRGLGLPAYRARQIYAWVHGRGATSTDQMTDLSRELRQQLAGQLDLTPLAQESQQQAPDGTRKLRLRCADGALVETVLIPDLARGKLTQCLSSQVGCGLGCAFCATASMGLRRNLQPAEIVDQVYRGQALLSEGQRISNLVLMGMGEPLNNLDNVLTAINILCTDLGANFSPRRITISTAGVVPGIQALGRRMPAVGLAISLNATTDEVRSELMPVNRRWPLAALLTALRRYPLPRRRRLTIEYVLIDGVNDTPDDARRLVRLLDQLRVKINLIAYNPVAAAQQSWGRPPDERVADFADFLRAKGLNTHLRQSRGQEIAAACGQLVTEDGRGPVDPGVQSG